MLCKPTSGGEGGGNRDKEHQTRALLLECSIYFRDGAPPCRRNPGN